MTVYDLLGVSPVINAAGPLTRLGGMPLRPEVAAAMAEAAQACVRMEDLQEAAGRELAEVCGAEAGYVTNGAAAGLALGAAAAIAGLDVAAMDRLPDTTGLRNEIVIQRAHLTAYTHALRVPGARLVEVGYMGDPGQGITWPWQLESAITERTAAIAFSITSVSGVVSLEDTVAIARRHDLPVIVDAAAALPPVENLRRFIAAGADLVAYSGGKAIGGPQASGILVGRSELIESVALQHQDMDVYPATWTWRARYLESGRLPGPPHHGLGRPMKVGKEEIAGLIVALRAFLKRDHAAERREQLARLATIQSELAEIPGLECWIDDRAVRAYPALVVRIDPAVVGRTAEEVVNVMAEGTPPVALTQGYLSQGAVAVVASALRPGEEMTITARLREVVSRQPAAASQN